MSWRPGVPLSNLSSMESYIEKLWAVCRCKVDTLKILFQFFHHNSGCLLTIWSYKSYHHHSARQKSVFPVVMRSCLTNGVMLTTFSYLGVCKNGLNLGCHTKLNARENRVISWRCIDLDGQSVSPSIRRLVSW